MHSAAVPDSPCWAMSVENIASLVVPMNCSFSARVNVWPARSRSSDSTAKCSGSLSMSTPSMSKMTASKRLTAYSADYRANDQNDGGAGGGQQHQLQARARTMMMRLRQQVACADREEHARKDGQQQAEEQVIQLGERANRHPNGRRKRIEYQQRARNGHPCI